jgi:O-succinylbenzoic acid--CoA ligase
VRKAWESGDAVFPIDQRLPQAAKDSLIKQFKPSVVIDSSGTSVEFSDSEPTRHNDALVIATSGTTGTPKGVVHTLDSIRALLNMSQSRLQTSSSTHWLLCLPVSHVAGFSIVARSIILGNPISILSKFDEIDVKNAALAGATHVSLVPTTLQRIDPTMFNTILLGGAAAPQNLPNNVVTTYGMTETFGGIAYNGQPLDGVEVRINKECIELKSPSLFRAYRGLNTNDSTGGWFATGDSGTFDQDRIRVLGRRDDMIITGGENVWPNAVEKVVATFPGVMHVVVSGVDDEHWGQRVVAWIVSSRDVAPSLDEIRKHVKTQLPSFCAPAEVRVVKEIPMTSLGKVDLQSLKKLQ